MAKAAKAPYRQGLQALMAGKLRKGMAAFEKAQHIDPQSYEVAFALAVVADRAGEPERALAYYRRALQLQPDYERAVDGVVKLYVRGGDAGAAIRFSEPIARAWERNLSLQVVYAEALLAGGHLSEAEAAARAVLRRDERFVPAMIVLARCSKRRGREELAASILEQALVIDPGRPEIHFLQGQVAEQRGQNTVALDSYRKAVAARPDFAEARTALGIQYMAGGNYAAAQQELEAAVRLAPTMPQAHLNLGEAYRANQRWAAAKRELDLALKLDGKMPAIHFDLALLYMQAGADYPDLTLLEALKRAVDEFNRYRDDLGPKLRSGDPSESYLADVTRRIEREEKRLERSRRKQQQAGGEDDDGTRG